MAQIVHKRAFVRGRAVAYCLASSTYWEDPGTTATDAAKVTCQECLQIMGRAR